MKNNKKTIGEVLLEAVKAKYVTKYNTALANLEVYLLNPVGVGEHSNIVAEIDKLICEADDADSKMNLIDKFLLQTKED